MHHCSDGFSSFLLSPEEYIDLLLGQAGHFHDRSFVITAIQLDILFRFPYQDFLSFKGKAIGTDPVGCKATVDQLLRIMSFLDLPQGGLYGSFQIRFFL